MINRIKRRVLVVGILFVSIFCYSQTSNVRISVSPNASTSSQQSSDVNIYNGTSTSDLSTGDVTCSLSNEGNDLIYDITYSGHDFDKDGSIDTLFCQLRVKGYKGSSVSYSETAASSSVTLGATSSPVKNTFSFWGVNGDSETTFNDIDLGETVSFRIENTVIKYSGEDNYSATSEITSVFANETNAGYGHKIIEGLGQNLNSYITNLSTGIAFSNTPDVVYLTGAGSDNANNTKEWGIQTVSLLVTTINDDNPYYWDLEDYSSYSVAASHEGVNYPANWMSEEKYPCFSWETIPSYRTVQSGTALSDEIYKAFAEYPFAGMGGSHSQDTWDEAKWFANAKLKSFNPTTNGDYYLNSEIIFPYYLHSDELLSHSEWIKEGEEIRGFKVINYENAELRKFWINAILEGIADENTDWVFIDKTSNLPSPFYDDAGTPRNNKAVMLDSLYRVMPANKVLNGNVLRNERDGADRSAMATFDASYLERWSTPHKDYNQTENEAVAVSIQLMREALKKGKVIQFLCDGQELIEQEDLTQENFYVPVAIFLIAVEENASINIFNHSITSIDDMSNAATEYFEQYLGAPLSDPIKDGYLYSRSFENLDVTLDLSGQDLASAKASFNWKGMQRPQPIYEYKSGTFKASIDSLSNFTLTENVQNPLRDCDCHDEFVGKLVKEENTISSIRFNFEEKPISSLEHGIFRFKVYNADSIENENISMSLINVNEVDSSVTELNKSQLVLSDEGWVEYVFDFRESIMTSAQYNALEIQMTSSGSDTTENTTYYFESLRGINLDPVASVTISQETLEMQLGETFSLEAEVLPSTAPIKTVTWTSSDTSIATVNSLGLVTAKEVGSATITVTTKDGGLSVECRVMVIPSGRNMALEGVATQSSTQNSAVAQKAIDGLMNGALASGSVSQTTSEENPWWQVELDADNEIDYIVVWKRTDECCKSELSNFTVDILDSKGESVFQKSFLGEMPDSMLAIACAGIEGRYVKVQLVGTSNLALAEVQVFGGGLAVGTTTHIEAEDYSEMNSVKTEECSEGTLNVGYIANGDWCAYEGISFENGKYRFEARVASKTNGGDIEIRSGSSTGELLATCEVNATGGWQTWKTVSCEFETESSVQDLYLVFTGSSGTLFNLNYFSFTYLGTEGETSSLSEETIVETCNIYPNPVSGQFNIELSNTQQATYALINYAGQTLLSGDINDGLVSVDGSELISGVYLMQISNEEGMSTHKVIVR